MKKQLRAYVAGVLTTIFAIVSIVGVSATQMSKNAVLHYNDIKICIDGNYITPKDANGNVVEPFIIDGTTYLPVRAVASSLGKNVEWDGATSTVFLGERPASTIIPDGSRTAPYNAALGAMVEFNEYSFNATHQLKITCTNVIKGEAGNMLIAKAWSGNAVPNANQEWIVFDLQISHISSSDGADSIFETSDLLDFNTFYKPDGSQMAVVTGAGFFDILSEYGLRGAEIYPGGSSRVVYAILTDKYSGDILLKVPYNAGKSTAWVKLNSDTNVITSTSELDKYIETTVPEAEQGVKITLKNTLPETIKNMSYSGTTEASFIITDFEYTSSSTSAYITFSGEKTYDSKGSGQSRAVKIGWKLYDSEGYVVDDGTAYGTSIKMGEKFKNCTDTIYSLEPGNYTLEIMSVN